MLTANLTWLGRPCSWIFSTLFGASRRCAEVCFSTPLWDFFCLCPCWQKVYLLLVHGLISWVFIGGSHINVSALWGQIVRCCGQPADIDFLLGDFCSNALDELDLKEVLRIKILQTIKRGVNAWSFGRFNGVYLEILKFWSAWRADTKLIVENTKFKQN